ncbi:uncharacterized protein [Temnothorax nylanderi]|uniref:uncharacterized protein isoform X2 n=1 Tax=Temnothorax nylanderi TaxID=102681 RepID=UPI003A88CFA5
MFSLSSKFQGQVKNKKERKDWWLFHATDFQSLMNPCFAFCRILGIFPYKINGSSFETSKPCYFLSAIVMCVFCFCALIIIMDIAKFNVQNVRRAIELYSFYIFGSFITVVTYILNGPRVRLLQTILKNSSRLPSKTYQEQSVMIHVKDIVGSFFLLVYLLICYYRAQHSILTEVVSSLYIILVVFQINMLYINCVCVLKACFKKIDFDLAHLLIMNDKPHLVRWIYREQRNPLLLMELKALKKQYLMVSDSVQVLNIIFSPQLLATIAIAFTEITFELYFNIVQWKNGGLSIRWKQTDFIYTMIYVMYYLMKIALIAWACETGKNEAIKISTTVHDVLNSTSDEQMKHELQLFSLQIMHCNKTFSAKGLTLGATLVTTVSKQSFVTIIQILKLNYLNLL